MVRVFDCKYLVAAVYGSSVCIQKTEVFVDVYGREEQQRKLEAEFMLSEGRRYTYLEWPPLTRDYPDSKDEADFFRFIDDRPLFLDIG